MNPRFFAITLAAILASCSGGPKRDSAQASELRFEATGANEAARGERLATLLGCNGCHGADLTGHVWFDEVRVGTLYTANLSRAMPRYSDSQLARTIRSGARPDGSPLWEMPSSIFSKLGDSDMGALIAFLRTVPPKGKDHPRIRIGPEGRRLIASGELKPEPQYLREERDKGPARFDGGHDWARYMIRATCTECHGIELKGNKDSKTGAGPPDLIIVAAYSLDQFRHLLRTGEPVGGRKLKLMGEVARGRFVRFTDREVDAIYAYLKARSERPQ